MTDFSYKGDWHYYQTHPDKKGIYYVKCSGASGADGNGTGGKGGTIEAYIELPPSKQLNISVGQSGSNTTGSHQPWGLSRAGSKKSTNISGCTGGSGTCISIDGSTLNHRFIVAGGGGGATHSNGGIGGKGGSSGGTASEGYGVNTQATGGKESSGGKGGTVDSKSDVTPVRGSDGAFGLGGDSKVTYEPGGTGGGGWYGGGCGGGDNDSSGTDYTGAGGGGSSYALTKTSYQPSGYALDPNLYTCFGIKHTTGNNSGNGSAKVDLICSYSEIRAKFISQNQLALEFLNLEGSFGKLNIKVDVVDKSSNSVLSSTKITGERTLIEYSNKNIKLNVYFEDLLKHTFDENILDAEAPTITFPEETYKKQHYEGETVTMYEGVDDKDKDLDYDYKVYINDEIHKEENNVKTTKFKLPSTPDKESYKLKIKVRAKQDANSPNGTGEDLWSDWYTSEEITIEPSIVYSPNFSSLLWLQGKLQEQVFSSPFKFYEVKHYCNGEVHSTITSEVNSIEPPLVYTPVKPELWEYDYYVEIRAKVGEGEYTDWYKSPQVKAQYDVPPTDIEGFTKEFREFYLRGSNINLEWKKSKDPNGSEVKYSVSLIYGDTVKQEWTDLEENSLSVVLPNDLYKGAYFTVVSYSNGLYSNITDSSKFNITDVNLARVTLDFPRISSNLQAVIKGVFFEINGKERIRIKTNQDLDNYEIPIHYFRQGNNTLKLGVIDSVNSEITREWLVNLYFNKEDLKVNKEFKVQNYLSFNLEDEEFFTESTLLSKDNLDLGVAEYTFLGETPHEGVTSVTQKLVITRPSNDDNNKLRTLKITGAVN